MSFTLLQTVDGGVISQNEHGLKCSCTIMLSAPLAASIFLHL